jgi:hypothetical protein
MEIQNLIYINSIVSTIVAKNNHSMVHSFHWREEGQEEREGIARRRQMPAMYNFMVLYKVISYSYAILLSVSPV